MLTTHVYYDNLHSDRTEETTISICQEIKKVLKKIKVVIDGNIASRNAYDTVFEDIIIQYCLFHFAKNVREAYSDEVGYGKGRSILPLQHLIGFFSILNIFFDHDREIIELRRLQNELNENIDRINRIDKSEYSEEEKQRYIEYIEDFNEKYDKKARKYLTRIKKIRRRKNGIKLTLRTEEQAVELLKDAETYNVFPTKVQKQVNRLKKNWENFTHCLRDNTIPPTSNKVEQYYALTLNWIEKNNLQSKKQFYQKQKFNLIKRYKLPLIKEGIFLDFLRATFTMLLTFGKT